MGKILCLIDTLRMGGGAERQMAGLAGMLYQRGLDVTLATYHQHDSDDYIEKKYGIRSVILETKQGELSKFAAVRKFIKQEGFNTVIAYKDGPTMICCLMKALGIRFHLIVSERNTTQRLNIRERAKFFLCRWSDVIVPNSISQQLFISTHFPLLASKTFTITNYTDTDYFLPSEKTDGTLPIKILTVARIAKQKNVKNYLHAIKQVTRQRSDVIFEWYGNVQKGEEDYWQECNELVKKMNISEYVTFHPATADIKEKYQECDVFSLPSLFEGYPNALCEAMSCGKPILCSRICDNPMIVREMKNALLFDPKSVDDMSRTILTLLSLPIKERNSMGERSRELAVEMFSQEVFVEKYIRLIEDLFFGGNKRKWYI